MGITTASIIGGVPDPYNGMGPVPANQQIPNAALENQFFYDEITVDLVTDNPNNTSISNVTVTTSIEGVPVSQSELTFEGNVTLNVPYVEPTASGSILTDIDIVVTVNPTSANVAVSGNISNAFSDKYWSYKNFETGDEITTTNVVEIPDEDVGLYLYKPSFMNYVNIFFELDVEYNVEPVVYTVQKRIINDHDINKQILFNLIEREENFRSNNYPRIYDAGSV